MKGRGDVSGSASTVCLGYHQLHAWNNPAVAWIVSHGVFMMMLPKFCALGITL